jgi:hypothetical protein
VKRSATSICSISGRAIHCSAREGARERRGKTRSERRLRVRER